MACEQFKNWKPQGKTAGLLHFCNEVIARLGALGYQLTLRQLFYQLVKANVIKNKQTEYKRLGNILNEARLAGLVDWDAIVDRTRFLQGVNHHTDPEDIIKTAGEAFWLNKWTDQEFRLEVWVEKDALVQVIEKACRPLDVDYFSCRGYTSQSELYGASKRIMRYLEDGQKPVIIHLGDHDPSGCDMTRDIIDRINTFITPYGHEEIQVERIALNMAQINQYHPPPNPAKNTDSRFADYKARHGTSCWELDALDVEVIDDLITKKVKSFIEDDKWDAAVEREKAHRESIANAANRWDEVTALLNFEPEEYRIRRRVSAEHPIRLARRTKTTKRTKRQKP